MNVDRLKEKIIQKIPTADQSLFFFMLVVGLTPLLRFLPRMSEEPFRIIIPVLGLNGLVFIINMIFRGFFDILFIQRTFNIKPKNVVMYITILVSVLVAQGAVVDMFMPGDVIPRLIQFGVAYWFALLCAWRYGLFTKARMYLLGFVHFISPGGEAGGVSGSMVSDEGEQDGDNYHSGAPERGEVAAWLTRQFGKGVASFLLKRGFDDREKVLGMSHVELHRIATQMRVPNSDIEKIKDCLDFSRIPGLELNHAWNLVEAGVKSMKDLARRNPSSLLSKLMELSSEKPGTFTVPPLETIRSWVYGARELASRRTGSLAVGRSG